VTETQLGIIRSAAENEQNVIVADTHLSERHRSSMKQSLERQGYTVEFKEFDVPLEELWKRDEQRENSVGKEVVYKMYQKWLQYKKRRTYTPGPDLPKAMLVDVDGTLAHMDGRKPYDWERVGEDLIDPVVRSLVNSGVCLNILLSGRDEIC